jgi:RNA polymerase sigma factor (sigma-70 family)
MTQFDNANELLDSFRAGDKNAYTIIFEKFYPQLVSYSCRMIHNEEQARQIATESLAKLFRRSHLYDSTENMEGFLTVATRNASLTYLRSLKAFRTNYNEYASPHDQLDAPTLERLFQSLQRLPEKSGRLANYLFVQGLPAQKVAELMETTQENIQNLRTYTVDKLKDDLPRSFDPAILTPFFAFLVNS